MSQDPLHVSATVLDQCAREPIHIPAAIQPFGVLLALAGDGSVAQCSADTEALLGRPPADVLGRGLAELLAADDAGAILRRLGDLSPGTVVRLAAVRPREPSRPPLSAALHRHDGVAIVELLPIVAAPTSAALVDVVQEIARDLTAEMSTEAFCGLVAARLRALTGYDRVMVYRFDPAWNGEVIAEDRRDDLEPYLGLHYPAADIPPQARALYLQNRVRVLHDAAAEPAPLVPRLHPETGRDLDLSYALLRAPAPVHREYLCNMGVRATLVASIVHDGALWGLISCHHVSPRVPAPEWSGLADGLAALIAAQIPLAHERDRARGMAFAQSLLRALNRSLGGHARLGDGLVAAEAGMMELMSADGLAVLHRDDLFTRGAVPPAEQIRRLVEWIERTGSKQYATDRLGYDAPEFAGLVDVAAGVLALHIPPTLQGWILWFRPEHASRVRWAGDLRKGLVEGDGPPRLTPRKSFAAWVMEVRGRSRAWTASELAIAAEVVRPNLLEVMAAVYQQQSEELRRYHSILFKQVHDVVIVSDMAGRITFWNEGAARILGWTAAEMVGRHVLDRIPAEQRDGAAALLAAALAGRPFAGRYQDTHKDGRAVWLDLRLLRIHDEADQPLGLMGISRDVTAQKLAEDRLRLERDIVRHVRDAILVTEADVIDPPGPRIVYANPALARDTGYAPEELVGKSPRIFQGPRSDRAALARIRAALARAEPVHEELINYRKDGSAFHVDLEISPLFDDSGKLTHFVSVQRDITDRKRVEDEIRRSEAFLRASGAMAKVGGWEFDLAAGWQRWTEEVFHIHELPIGREPTIAESAAFYAPEWRERLRELTERAAAHREPYDVELPLLTARGNSKWVHIICQPTPGRGPTCRLVGTIQDISDRKRAEAALRASEERLRLALDGGRIGLFDWDMQADRIVWSRLHYEVLGYRDGEPAEVKYHHFIDRIHPDDLPALERHLQAAIAERTQYRVETRVLWPDGTVRWISGTGSCLYDDDGRPYRMLGVVADISDRRRADAQRLQLEEQLRQSQKMEALGQLASGVAHDFNNILTVISSLAELLAIDLPEGAPQAELIEELRATGDRGAGLTRQLLAFSRKQVVRYEVFVANEVIANMSRMLIRLLGSGVILETRLAPDLWPVRADRGQLEQVVMNLVLNARDAMPSGGWLLIETANVVLAADDGTARPHVRLTVTDNGVGMTEEVKARIFEPFFTTKEKGRGTGLGMSTVYGIVQQSRGRISLASAPGRGTAVTIELPRAEVDAPPTEAVLPEPASRGHETVLLVEDDDPLRALGTRLLRSAGYDVIAAASGEEALVAHAVHGRAIALVLTDVVMPGISGRDLAEQLHARDPALKIVFTSGYIDDSELRHGIEQERVALLPKPYGLAELARFVRAALDRG